MNRRISRFAAALTLALVLSTGLGVAQKSKPSATAATQEASAVSEALRNITQNQNYEYWSDLYDSMHPDSKSLVSRDVAIAWFEDNLGENPPSYEYINSENIAFITWTWPVNGKTYPNTAQVSMNRTINGTRAVETVHLVQSDDGDWSWFFGRTLDFVNQQATTYDRGLELRPRDQDVLLALDAFWNDWFTAHGLEYEEPAFRSVVPVQENSPCIGDSYDYAGFYCSTTKMIYLDIVDYRSVVDVEGAWWPMLLAHEWGHHIQTMMDVNLLFANSDDTVPGTETQADCLAGAFLAHASANGIVGNDVIEAAFWDAKQDSDTTHGTGIERNERFMAGFNSGVTGCGIAI